MTELNRSGGRLQLGYEFVVDVAVDKEPGTCTTHLSLVEEDGG